MSETFSVHCYVWDVLLCLTKSQVVQSNPDGDGVRRWEGCMGSNWIKSAFRNQMGALVKENWRAACFSLPTFPTIAGNNLERTVQKEEQALLRHCNFPRQTHTSSNQIYPDLRQRASKTVEIATSAWAPASLGRLGSTCWPLLVLDGPPLK